MLGRILLYAIIAALGLFVLGTTFALEHGGYTSSRPPVTVHDLRSLPDSYKGQVVTTEGTLHYSADLNQYAVVDSDNQAVVVQGYNEAILKQLVGKIVIATGRFDIGEGIGVFIALDSLGPAN